MKVFFPCDILLPKNGTDMTKWSVIACDQHSSDRPYWEETTTIVGDAPSALSLILPECYLEADNTARIDKINAAMRTYEENELFTVYHNAYIYLERTLPSGKLRKGLIGAIDLEAYSFQKGANVPIRASEETVTERIPPRVKIREHATLEMPHIMLLIDDVLKKVIEPLAEQTDSMTCLYDFDLMQDGGHVKGYLVPKDSIEAVNEALDALDLVSPFLFAVGDGNHSLATAKTCYEKNPSPKARQALVEVVNIHDDALDFEPIYRVLFHADADNVKKALLAALPITDEGSHTVTLLTEKSRETLTIGAPSTLTVTDLQHFLDDYLSKHPEVTIDYIHGLRETENLCREKDTVGFLFDGMKKEDLFPAVFADGALVRKTFSMGEAADKRYYLECRKIK